ncbi:MAG: efflux RND transporter periplasmic adaptor subunit [Chlorobiota bacterium]|nr:MAG: efflux RND transporter periplasmic adaptor subunit [Chlorobiota bacterium]
MKKVIGLILVLLGGFWIFTKLKHNKEEAQNKVQKSEVFTVPTVTTIAIKKEEIVTEVSSIGTVIPNKEVQLSSETSGRVMMVNFENGSRVSTGQLLAKVDDELRKTAVDIALINLEKAKKDQTRIDTLFQASAVAQSQSELVEVGVKGAETQLKIAQRLFRDTKITSPISGVITMKFIEKGSTLGPGSPVAIITDISKLKVKVSIPEQDAFKIHKGDRVQVTTDVYPNEKFNGYVKLIASKGDEAHNFPIEIELSNVGSRFKAGMFAKIIFSSIPSKVSLVVPREAIIGSIKSPQVYVLKNDKVELKNIIVDDGTNTKLVIKSGLSEGDVIVLNGQNNLIDGVKVNVQN